MEAVWFKSHHFSDPRLRETPVVVCLGFGGRDIPDRSEQTLGVKPGHPLQRRQLDSRLRFPWPAAVDQLGLVQSVDGLGERVVVAVTAAAYGWFDARFCEPFAVANRHVLRPAIAVVDQGAATLRPARV